MVSTSERRLLIDAYAVREEACWTLARCALGLIAIAAVSAIGLATVGETAPSTTTLTASRVATGR